MSSIAISFGDTSIYYSSIVLALGLAACLFLTWFLFVSHRGNPALLCIFAPVSVVLSVFLSRLIHWYCHTEQYTGFFKAITDYSSGDFVLSGVFIGVLISYAVLVLFRRNEDTALLLDCLAPGLTVFIILARLSCIFSSSFRSKIAVEKPLFQQLPFAAPFSNSAGSTEYRFAAFFWEAILLSVLLTVLLVFFSKLRLAPAKNGKSNSGSVWMMFLVWYSAVEVVMDSTRYDSSFARFNGFVSVVQTFCGVMMLAVLIWYSVRAVKADGLRAYHWKIWSGWFVALAVAGISEYLVQRHGDWYLSCYFLMSVCLVIMAWLTVRMYKHQCE